ncbi:class I SAM-dependent DNA methyltransferase [Ramlibacter sp. H39-3-26]|uniref:class I SAM-dependent DNA methyltransferase n=1 Tax=Curvibacter soli TaxID=3031331 RepID=UPI0023DC8E15|nr:DNA methyltransferase [Ramlibacter sp. H39-3-26]MDF1486574.1 class I SAM-dependent DNA methyltransferase [Ramlibacter sp. H39-3-26]
MTSTATAAIDATATQAFIQRWQHNTASELATAQSFVMDLCELLGVAKPHPTPGQDYMFERPVTFAHGDGSTSSGRIDCYRRGHFVLEAKKLKAAGHTKGFDDGLLRARSQGEAYARALPAHEGRPPFVLVVDVGTVIEVYAEFSKTGGTYTPYPDPRSHRLQLADLARPEVQDRLRRIWTDPDSLNPARISAQVTRDVAALLAQLAKSLEGNGANFKPNQPLALIQQAPIAPETVAAYLTRCLFSMFAEDVELLPKGAFLGLLQTHRDDPATLQQMLRILWADMDRGGFSAALAKPVLHFNGKLFKGAGQDGYSLLLTPAQVDLLIAAAQSNWREVEPAIFGTLLERALDPAERHALGAHYTPRAYVERLVLPTVIEPLRAAWSDAQAAALVLAHEANMLQGKAMEAKLAEARAEVKKFHHQLCTTRVLDPACGSANFLYVTLEHLKRLEGEIVNQLEALGHTQDQLGFEGETVTLQQLRGIELNERAAAMAELVLWIGYLQWHIRTRGNAAVAEPVVHNYGNIECRDAVLAWDAQELAYNAAGQLLSRWDGRTFKTHPVTGEQVPDEAAQVPQWRYLGARKAQWPQADFIVGNPPFIGNKRMRDALGDGYVQALRGAWPEIPESADFVMFWWHHAAAQVAAGHTRRMGLITTNSLTMVFNRRVVQAALDKGTHLHMAIADHPWVDSANGAAVRIAMTVLASSTGEGSVLTVEQEIPGEHGEVAVTLTKKPGLVHADLTVGANVAAATPLRANAQIGNRGVIPHGAGFIVSKEEAAKLGNPPIIRAYRNGRDLTETPRGAFVIDAHGLSAEELRDKYPAIYQWLLERVKPDREQNNRARVRDLWWLFAEARVVMRASLSGLKRYIVTGQVAKHRVFQFLDASILPDDKLIAIALDDAFSLGVLSSQLHVCWALALGGRLGVGNDPVYSKSTCFDTFPFPDEDTGLTPPLRERIAHLAEQIDAHRKRVLAPEAGNAGLTLTGIYNVLTALREGRALTPKEKTIHTQGLVGVLRELHDELDAAVLAAYGLPANASTDGILAHLVQLNTQRAAEEAQGRVRWLRPAFQNPQNSLQKQELLPQEERAPEADFDSEKSLSKQEQTTPPQHPWPATLPEQVRAVAAVLAHTPAPLTLAAIELRFKGRGPWKKSLPTLLQTLEALGRAQAVATGGELAWRG